MRARMNRSVVAPDHLGEGRSRARADEPQTRPPREQTGQSFPCVRGGRRVVPVRARMDRKRPQSGSTPRSRSRACADGPQLTLPLSDLLGSFPCVHEGIDLALAVPSFPCARGWTGRGPLPRLAAGRRSRACADGPHFKVSEQAMAFRRSRACADEPVVDACGVHQGCVVPVRARMNRSTWDPATRALRRSRACADEPARCST